MKKKIIRFIIFIIFLIIFFTILILIDKAKPKVKKKKINVEEKQIADLKINIPESFKLDTENEEDNRKYYDYSDKDLENVCIIMIEYKDLYETNIEDEAKDQIYVKGDYKIEQKEINKHNWAIVSIRYNPKTTYYAYATTYNNKIYTIKYDDIGIGNECEKSYKKIMKTLKFGE